MTTSQQPARRHDPIPYAVRLISCVFIGVATAVIGTGAHRMGAASNVPYGLALAFALVALASVMSRALAGSVGLGLHLIVSSVVVYLMSGYGPGGDIMMPTGGAALTTFFSLNATLIWMGGLLLIQVVVIMLPRTMFARFAPDVPRDMPRDVPRDTSRQPHHDVPRDARRRGTGEVRA